MIKFPNFTSNEGENTMYKLIGDDYIFGFGKHKGEKILDVMDYDPQYVKWCNENLDWFDLDVDMLDELEVLLDEDNSIMFASQFEEIF